MKVRQKTYRLCKDKIKGIDFHTSKKKAETYSLLIQLLKKAYINHIIVLKCHSVNIPRDYPFYNLCSAV